MRSAFQSASVEDWFRFAPPQGKAKQWRDGRSAKELAKVWCRDGAPAIPSELAILLDSNPLTRGIVFERGIAEKVTRLDEFDPGHRNHDLVLVGRAGGSRILLAIESKADESFGATIADALADSAKRAKKRGQRSNLPARISALCKAMLGCETTSAQALRYQLLHASAGTLIEAKLQQAQVGVFIVHEFVTDATKDDRHTLNARDLCDFFARFDLDSTKDGSILVGPITVPGGVHIPAEIPLWIGRVVTNLRG